MKKGRFPNTAMKLHERWEKAVTDTLGDGTVIQSNVDSEGESDGDWGAC